MAISASSLTADVLAEATGITVKRAGSWLPYIQESAEQFGFSESVQLAMWLAQCGHESDGFVRLIENLNYSAAGLRRVWPSRFKDDAEAFERQPTKIANRVYANRMGNGPPESGDGWTFRGRGLIQLTGRANYKACGAALKVDLLVAPDLLATAKYAALSAGWFWSTRKLTELGDDVAKVTKRINGGAVGLADRTKRFKRALLTLGE